MSDAGFERLTKPQLVKMVERLERQVDSLTKALEAASSSLGKEPDDPDAALIAKGNMQRFGQELATEDDDADNLLKDGTPFAGFQKRLNEIWGDGFVPPHLREEENTPDG